MSHPRSPDEERRRIFRRMELIYVYLPPVLAFVFASIGSILIGFLVPIPGTTFWGRWALGMLVLLVIPGIVYVTRSYLKR